MPLGDGLRRVNRMERGDFHEIGEKVLITDYGSA
jgi:hypothetical protein